jgi:hypothetical protein
VTASKDLKNITLKMDVSGAIRLKKYLDETHKNYPLDSKLPHVVDARKLIITLNNIIETYQVDV